MGSWPRRSWGCSCLEWSCEPLISRQDVPLRYRVGCVASRSKLPRERFSPLALFGHRGDDDEGLLLGAKRTCRLSFGQVSELSVPLDRELLEERIELEARRLPAFENGLDDLGCEQGEAKNAAEVGFIDGLGFGEVAEGGVVSL